MSITKKPRVSRPDTDQTRLPEAAIQALIGKGGSVAQAEVGQQPDQHKPQLVQLRLERPLVERVDAVLAARMIKIPRHTWLLEAVHEKLVREEKSQ